MGENQVTGGKLRQMLSLVQVNENLLDKVIKTTGAKAQTIKAAEEISELGAVISKLLYMMETEQVTNEHYKAVAKEYADAFLMMFYLMKLCDSEFSDTVLTTLKEKLERLELSLNTGTL